MVAAIILIAVTVAVSIAVAAWMGALTFTFMATEELKILSVSFDEGMTIDVQNTGTSQIVIVEVKAGNETANTPLTLPETQSPNPLSAGARGTINWTAFVWSAGTSYDIQILTAKGNRFTYRATAPT